jgi:non-homologous end joining protein Ku
MLSWERFKAMAAMAASSARDIWKGSISFVLVNIPIQVFSATQKEDIHLINYVTMDIKSNTKNGVP